ncbi:MAG: hypothetical protein ABR540_04570 [Acidimicrobiales bacterium]
MHFGIFGDRRAQLPPGWTKETVVGIFGDTTLDASAPPGPDPALTLVNVFSETTVYVPKGSRIKEGGFSVFGDQEVDVAAGGEGAAEIRIQTFGLFGELKVVEREG